MLRILLKGLIILWWRKYWLLGTVALVLGSAGAYHYFSAPVYEAEAIIETGLPEEGDYPAQTETLIERFLIAEDLQENQALSALEAREGRIWLRVQGGDAGDVELLAEDLAHSLLRQFRSYHHQQRNRAEEELETLDTRISDLRSNLRRLSAEQPDEADNLYFATRALVEDSTQERLDRLQAEREALANRLERLERPGPGMLRAPQRPERPARPDYDQLWRVAGTLAALLGLLAVVLAQRRADRRRH